MIKNIFFLQMCIVSILFAKNTLEQNAEFEKCINQAVKIADDTQTIGQIRKQCNSEMIMADSLISKRKILENEVINNPFAIIPYKPNYILPFSYSKPNYTPYKGTFTGEPFKDIEVVYQVSLKILTWEDVFVENLDLYAGFTLKSWWQAYTSDISSPFRETNYQPELIFSYENPWSLFGLPIIASSVSINHQSNGGSGELSRSWNRIIGEVAFETGDIVWNVKSWWRIPEDEKSYPGDPSGDDNPDIEKFLGYGELGMLWKLPYDNNLDVMLRNNLRSDNKGAVQVGWSFPLSEHLRGYVEYFNGYGESLIYYNEHTERIGIGVKLTDWL